MALKVPRIFLKKPWLTLLVGVFVGGLLVLVIRLITYSPEEIHYHANFAVYINGQREQFKEQFYYEAVTSCTLDQQITSEQRVHMHDEVNDVVHVHDGGVAWGHFFQNLGWFVGPDLIKALRQVHLPDDKNKITFILNGEKFSSITNQIIGDRDKLLVDFGVAAEETLQKEYQSIASTAQKYNAAQDPKSCRGSSTPTLNDRLKHLL